MFGLAISATDFLEQNDALISREHEMARELLKKGQKEKAKLLLRKKKYHQSLIEKTYAKLENIDEMVRNPFQFFLIFRWVHKMNCLTIV